MSRKYEKPPIQEAVCEFRFADDLAWDMTLPGLLYDKIKDRYPEKKQRLLSSTELFQEEGTLGQKLTQESRILFYDKEGTRLVQVGDHLLTINALAPYRGWAEDFQPHISSVLESLLEIVKPECFLRAGLRYINMIELPGPRVELPDYFKFHPSIGPELPQDHISFILGCQFPFEDEKSLCKVLLTSAKAGKVDAQAALLDLDLYMAVPNALLVKEAHSWLNWAHDKVNGIFEGCITDALRKMFKEVH